MNKTVEKNDFEHAYPPRKNDIMWGYPVDSSFACNSVKILIENLILILQTSELLSFLYLIQRQIGASHNAYFKFYLSKKDGCIGTSVVCMILMTMDKEHHATLYHRSGRFCPIPCCSSPF